MKILYFYSVTMLQDIRMLFPSWTGLDRRRALHGKYKPVLINVLAYLGLKISKM